MSLQLGYDLLHEYDPGKSGITLEALLRSGTLTQRLWAKVDTGSSYCVFQREIGEALGLDIESGLEEWIGTQTGSMRVFGHEVTLETLWVSFHSMVYFAAHYGLPRNVLGRFGWLQRLKFGLVDYEAKLYLGLYSQE